MAFRPSRSLTHRQPNRPLTPSDWRCRCCGKLLAIRRSGRLHIAVQGHDYLVTAPAEATCRSCGTFNRT